MYKKKYDHLRWRNLNYRTKFILKYEYNIDFPLKIIALGYPNGWKSVYPMTYLINIKKKLIKEHSRLLNILNKKVKIPNQSEKEISDIFATLNYIIKRIHQIMLYKGN